MQKIKYDPTITIQRKKRFRSQKSPMLLQMPPALDGCRRACALLLVAGLDIVAALVEDHRGLPHVDDDNRLGRAIVPHDGAPGRVLAPALSALNRLGSQEHMYLLKPPASLFLVQLSAMRRFARAAQPQRIQVPISEVQMSVASR